MNGYEYLENKEFLRRLDNESRKVLYVRIYVLNFKTEQPIACLEGVATGGSINLSGTSGMRRTASCSIAVDKDGIKKIGATTKETYHKITEVNNLISINKKIRFEVGYENTLIDEYYNNYNIIWFPLGTFIIKTANLAKSESGFNISLSLVDKTALINGDVGGTIPAATIFSEMDIFNTAGTEKIVQKILIKDIIKTLLVEFGGEMPENIIITDIPDTIKRVVKWTGSGDLYYNGQVYSKQELDDTIRIFKTGDNIGYVNEPFSYPGTLECNAGEAVAAVLDKIKNTLGNFEWFYDVFGRFHFQAIKNYVNENPTINDLVELKEENYFSVGNLKSVYTFDNDNFTVTNISSSPQYMNIKNDFVIWGSRKTVTGSEKPIRYHLALDDKPDIGENYRECIIYIDSSGLQQYMPVVLGQNCFRYNDSLKEGNYNDISVDTEKNYYYLMKTYVGQEEEI